MTDQLIRMISSFLLSGSARMRQLSNDQVGLATISSCSSLHACFLCTDLCLSLMSMCAHVTACSNRFRCRCSESSGCRLFRLRDELTRSNEQIEEYRHLIYLINEKNLSTNIDDLTRVEYFDDGDDDCRPMEKNFCLDDPAEQKFIFLYGKLPVCDAHNDDDDDDEGLEHFSILSHLQNEIR